MITPVLTIEPMAARNIDVVRAIDARCYSSPWGAATWRNELAEKTRHHVVARMDDEVLGHAGLLIMLDEVHVTTVAIHPDHQSRGLGTQLVLHLLDHARMSGARRQRWRYGHRPVARNASMLASDFSPRGLARATTPRRLTMRSSCGCTIFRPPASASVSTLFAAR